MEDKKRSQALAWASKSGATSPEHAAKVYKAFRQQKYGVEQVNLMDAYTDMPAIDGFTGAHPDEVIRWYHTHHDTVRNLLAKNQPTA